METNFTEESMLLHTGFEVSGMDLTPEAMPLFQTNAFSQKNLSSMKQTYVDKGFTYIRTRNPNRTALEQSISLLENGEDTLIFASGMAAISSTLIAFLSSGDRILCNSNIYGETFQLLSTLLNRFGIIADFVDFENLEAVKSAITPAAKMLYCEVVSNPTMSLSDLEAIAKIAHNANALLMVDNTFTTPFAIKPINWGADIVINSLTKFLNGHSDAVAGSITSTTEIIQQIKPVSMLLGTPGTPFESWLIFRSMQTAGLRIPQQMRNAQKIAEALSKHKLISKVHYPGLENYPQRKLADKMFKNNGFSAMLSFVVPEKIELMDLFLEKLYFTKYAPTLGGSRTTIQHPVTSSHPDMPDHIRRKIGITPGMFRLSVGLENPDDLIADFMQALSVFE